MCQSRPLSSLFSPFQHRFNRVDYPYICQCMDSNREYLMYEATYVPTEPQPLPYLKPFTAGLCSVLIENSEAVISVNWAHIPRSWSLMLPT